LFSLDTVGRRPEDDVSEEYRKDLALVMDELVDDEDYSMVVRVSRFVILIFFGLFAGGAGWYSKRLERRRSGRHKKTDECCSSPNEKYGLGV
jgi:hypothetical protein